MEIKKVTCEYLMDIDEAIERIEFQIEEDLKTQEYTTAGRMDVERIKQLNEYSNDILNKLEKKDALIQTAIDYINNYRYQKYAGSMYRSLKDDAIGINLLNVLKEGK